MAKFLPTIRRMWRAFRNEPAPSVRHYGHDVATTVKDATHTTRGDGVGLTGDGVLPGSSAVEEHATSGASDYAKSFDKDK